MSGVVKLSEMDRIVAADPSNSARISPYIGGEEVNDSPTNAHRRYVINFDEMTEGEARQWPDLMRIVEDKVRPERMRLKDTADGLKLKERWWLYARSRPEMRRAIAGQSRALTLSEVSTYLAFAFLPTNIVFAHTLKVFALDDFAGFSVLQSRVHETWARFFASSLEDRLRYTPSDCFETFPCPLEFGENQTLERAGRKYYEFRADFMVRNNQGLTAIYNRFHDPEERDPEIGKLRELHSAMDRAVLDAYGWSDFQSKCEFLLDYEEEEDVTGSRRKKPWRYRWPDEFRDEVLARLLELNRQRAEQEMLDGPPAMEKKPRKPGPKKPPAQLRGHSLFPRD
jgi:hypothetical protein